jgi:hypothetical protein
MAKTFDLTKFRKSLTKSIDGLGVGFNDPTDWVSTGNYALNYLISGDFQRGIPLGKVTVFAGESGAGKSYICSGNIVKHAQEQGIFVVLIDSENALDEKWFSPPHQRRRLPNATLNKSPTHVWLSCWKRERGICQPPIAKIKDGLKSYFVFLIEVFLKDCARVPGRRKTDSDAQE